MIVLSMGCRMAGFVRRSVLYTLPLWEFEKFPAPVVVLRLGASVNVRSLSRPPRLACFVVSTAFVTRPLLSLLPPLPLPPPLLPQAASSAALAAVAPVVASTLLRERR